MAGRSRVDQSDRKLTRIPPLDTFSAVDFVVLDLLPVQPFPYPFQIVLIPVRHQNRLSVCCFDQVFQRIQLFLMERQHLFVIGVDCTTRQLRELSTERRSIRGSHFILLSHVQHQFFSQFIVLFLFLFIHRDHALRHDLLRHL